jgi:hypothetical protein
VLEIYLRELRIFKEEVDLRLKKFAWENYLEGFEVKRKRKSEENS